MRYVNFEKLETTSGMTIYLMDLPSTNTVAAGVLVKAGTRDEIWPEEAGLAHALEHMVFLGTEKFPESQSLNSFIEDVGGSGNAWTDRESMFFYHRVPAKEKERAFISLGEIMNHPLIPEKKVLVEAKNIIEEIKMYKDQPYDYLSEELVLPIIFGRHPGSRTIAGNEKSVRSFRREDYLRFKEKFLHPANFSLIVAGNIDDDDALKLVEENFPEKKTKPENQRKTEAAEPNPKSVFIYKKELNQTNLMLAAAISGSHERSTDALEMFSTMISGGSSFPLYQEIRDQHGLCYDINSGVDKMTDAGMFQIYIGTNPERYKQAIELTLEIIEKNKNNKELLERAKKISLGKLVMGFENTDQIINMAAADIIERGEPKNYKTLKQEIESVSIKEVEEAVNTFLTPDKIKQIILMPKGEPQPTENK